VFLRSKEGTSVSCLWRLSRQDFSPRHIPAWTQNFHLGGHSTSGEQARSCLDLPVPCTWLRMLPLGGGRPGPPALFRLFFWAHNLALPLPVSESQLPPSGEHPPRQCTRSGTWLQIPFSPQARNPATLTTSGAHSPPGPPFLHASV
jgi:hypothetical protein